MHIVSREIKVIDSHGNFVAKLETKGDIQDCCGQGQTLAVVTGKPAQLLIGDIKVFKQTIEICSLSKVRISPDESRITVSPQLSGQKRGLSKFFQVLF